MTRIFLAGALALSIASVVAASPPRRTVVLARGTSSSVETGGDVVTVAPAFGLARYDDVVGVSFDQYGRTLSLQGKKTGEAKLLIEYTDSNIGEIIRVVVVEKPVADRYQFALSSLAGVEALDPNAIHAAADQLVITGTMYSAADLQRCIALEQQGQPVTKARRKAAAVRVVCAARLSPAAVAVHPDQGYDARANLAISEEPAPAGAGAQQGAEGESIWRATVRFAEVPILQMTSRNRADLLARLGRFVAKLNHSIGEWKRTAEARAMYPTTFTARPTPTGHELRMTWKFDQGRAGEALVSFTPADVQDAAARAGGADRLVQWWAAVLQDTFRLYLMAARPLRTLTGADDDPLLALYRRAVRISGGQFDRTNAAVALARAHFATRLATGSDPFTTVLLPPSRFAGSSVSP